MKILPILLLSVFLITCKDDEDPCENVTCLNGGTCANGECVCTDRYEGADCSKQVTPSKIRITKVQVTRFPATEQGGGGWDFDSGADIFPTIHQGNTLVWISTVYMENASPNQSYDFTSASPVDLLPATAYTITLYDDDQPADPDWLGGINFTITDSMLEDFPDELDIDTGTGAVAFRVSVLYIF